MKSDILLALHGEMTAVFDPLWLELRQLLRRAVGDDELRLKGAEQALTHLESRMRQDVLNLALKSVPELLIMPLQRTQESERDQQFQW